MKLLKLAALGTIAVGAMCGVGFAQTVPQGAIYSFHSGAQGGCPGLDWHVVAEANDTLDGMIAWNNMKSMAHATGTLNPTAKTFEMTAKEVGGQGRTAEITGTVEANGYLVANIKGPEVNCSNVTVPWGRSSGGNG